MTTYVAFLRGIGPGNPNMRNEKLREVVQDLGFEHVRSVISSGNILFDSDFKDAKALETKIEQAWPKKLGFKSTTIIRSKVELQKLVNQNPFGKIEHSPKTNINVTFLKNPQKIDLKFPYKVEDRDYTLLGVYEGAVCSVIDLTSARTPDLMIWLEKQFGKEITTRTWKTVNRILKLMKER